MDLGFTGTDRAFQDEVRSFLRQNLPETTQRQTLRSPSYVPADATREWHRILARKGWVAPHWPKEHGGTGWTPTQKHIFEEEYQAAHAPRLSPFGLTMVGPVIYTFGTEAQKQQHLPKILSGEVFWCQGYSEPGSGSDLASLKTRAVREGDHYVVNGHKIWTSHAHHADWIFCLVRTDVTAKQQEGISFLLIDIRSPGIEVRPIISMDGGHYLNEVFFTDVKVPLTNRIGEENKGWTYAKFLLGHERTGIAGVAKSKEKVRRLKEMARLQDDGMGGCLWDEPGFRDRVSLVEARLSALEITNLRILDSEAGGRRAGPETSTLKLCGTEIEQGLNELMVEILAYYAVPYEPHTLRLDSNIEPVAPESGLGIVAEHLLRRAASIYGGSNEIQRNIIAKMVLAL
jgi:alkylation response protein AidB-like acyl-CoA dehydrogenase